MVFVPAVVGVMATDPSSGALLATVTESLTAAPLTVPSFGVTSTLTTSPALPLPEADVSKVSVSEEEPDVVWRTVPLTFQTYVNVTGSASGSDFVAVAVRVASVVGDVGDNETVATGASFTAFTVTLTVAMFESAVPSVAR